MAFVFQIAEACKARRPIVVLFGEVLEGGVQVGDRVSVPLTDGTRFVGSVIGVTYRWDDFGMCPSVQAGEHDEPVGIMVERWGCHEADDIAPGVATDG